MFTQLTGITYKIVRFRFEGRDRIVRRGLTLEEAQTHCQDPKRVVTDGSMGMKWSSVEVHERLPLEAPEQGLGGFSGENR